jgi:type VI secretion system secreted protein Hcp
MAVDMFLTLTGIEGETKDKAKKDDKAMDVLAWSWGMSNSGTFHQGGGGGSGKVNMQDISVTKFVDKASTTLFLMACNGEHIEEGKLMVRKAGKNPLEYLIITMKKVLVTSVSTGGSGGEDRLTENITLNFAAVEVEYAEQKDDGSGDAAATFLWDVEANANE